MKRFQAEIDLIKKSGLFDTSYYLKEYPDVVITGMDPIEHYLKYGALLLRRTSEKFDTKFYLSSNPDIAAIKTNPLLHYIQYGIHEGRVAHAAVVDNFEGTTNYSQHVANRKLQGKPRRFFPEFDEIEQARFLAKISLLYKLNPDRYQKIKVSIIMPTYNRGSSIKTAIDSVRKQSHENWELLVVDDGSTDESLAILKGYQIDGRFKVFRQNHQGVSAARNTGLTNASGDYIFYLDSDNRWEPHYINAMLVFMEESGVDCAYSGVAVENEEGKITGYRGEPFVWEDCLHSNYIDLNVFAHRREVYLRCGGFDESLRRMVDWDLILRYTNQSRVAYAPFIGCYYSDSSSDKNRISVMQPLAYKRVVQLKHRPGKSDPVAIARDLRLRFAIKIPAPYEKRQAWGDFHYAESLQDALKALGHQVTIDFLGDWYDRPVNQDDVVIVLRGLTKYEPRGGQINVLWNISHPDQVSYDEYESYDLIYAASLSYPSLLNNIITKNAKTLLQCVDVSRFRFSCKEDESNSGVLFVGNSRREYRKIVKWAIESDCNVNIYGTNWDQFVDSKYKKGENIANTELAAHYAQAKVVLNDHWDSMRVFGFISNRIFDVLSCGGRVISDPIPAIARVFGDAVIQVGNQAEFKDALLNLSLAQTDMTTRLSISRTVGENHSFDHRARTICNDIITFLGLPAPHAESSLSPYNAGATASQRLKIGLLLQGKNFPTSSGFIRLIAPLTTEEAYVRFDTLVLHGVDDPQLDDCDICIIQRLAVSDSDVARSLVARLKAKGTQLIIDNDDAFALLPPTHPEKEALGRLDATLRYLISEADDVWFSTEVLQGVYADVARKSKILSNALDPRIWKDYRKPARTFANNGVLRMLYMGTATHDADFQMIMPALDALEEAHPGTFEVTIIGAVRKPQQRRWLKVLSPPPQVGMYPRFARWLGEQGPFDIGLAPLEENAFNACKSDIKFLDYCAIGLLSVLSDVPAYRGAAKDRELAICVPNTTEDWFARLEEILLHRQRFAAMVDRASAYVWEERSSLITLNAMLDSLRPN